MTAIKAEIITIGDEILYGQITDTNSQWMSERLTEIGVKVIRKTAIGDTKEAITEALDKAKKEAQIVLMTGGLGPTKDDITKKTLANYFDTELIFNENVYENIGRLLRQFGRELTEQNKNQAEVLKICDVLQNEVGTAPGMWIDHEGCVFVSMPGVPHEMKFLMSEHVLPRLEEKYIPGHIIHKVIRTIGIPESKLSQMLEDWELALPENIGLAYLPKLGQVRLRLTAVGEDKEAIELQLESEVLKLKSIVTKGIYAEEDIELEEVVGIILKQRDMTVATAESCTGGNVANKITDISGSSAYFKGGIIPYSNEIKMDQLGVRAETLEKYGAVSEQTAKEMAENVRKKFNASVGISTTGIAGPTGGTPDKPVGTIWIGYSDGKKTEAKLLNITRGRKINVQYTTTAVLRLLWSNLANEN
ncbi:competence/damage-inducible protein A [Sediminitomix flava]|uniref:CinA-like protein n=1 Tax=Sediminitomix flava TaxID=379075 RepID=A0A315ZFK1_SEDFL|nr:competence/damage-inducible protein A [Sediminitomix flava]PWJ44366.1 competence/damage-inducible protein cinA [Sediminitomix flava]